MNHAFEKKKKEIKRYSNACITTVSVCRLN